MMHLTRSWLSSLNWLAAILSVALYTIVPFKASFFISKAALFSVIFCLILMHVFHSIRKKGRFLTIVRLVQWEIFLVFCFPDKILAAFVMLSLLVKLNLNYLIPLVGAEPRSALLWQMGAEEPYVQPVSLVSWMLALSLFLGFQFVSLKFQVPLFLVVCYLVFADALSFWQSPKKVQRVKADEVVGL